MRLDETDQLNMDEILTKFYILKIGTQSKTYQLFYQRQNYKMMHPTIHKSPGI